ncbi:hypothetical protein EV363DRAFT_778413 [Boletus edulis]|nr:hypothetical protein EV363DRAFT_778413 [Boletus edulis]
MSHILDWKRVIEHCGTNDFIPQTIYTQYTGADWQEYVRDVEFHETIFFFSNSLGISLDETLNHRVWRLKDKDDRMLAGCGPSVSIRIQWPGYPSWSKQIPTMNFKTPRGQITRAKLAKSIATCVRRFIESMQDKPMEAGSDRRWKVGERHIKAEDLILVSLHQVTKRSWQPQLRLRRSILSFPSTSTVPTSQ